MRADPLTMLQVASAIALGAAGVWALAQGRRERPPAWIALPGVGSISSVSLTVTGLAGLLIAYHLFVYAANFAQFRAPMWIVLVGGLGAVALSLLIDALEQRSDSDDDD